MYLTKNLTCLMSSRNEFNSYPSYPSITWVDHYMFESVNFIIFKNIAMRLNYAIWLVKIMTQSPNYKVYEKLTRIQSVIGRSDLLCDSVNRGLTLVRLCNAILQKWFHFWNMAVACISPFILVIWLQKIC